MDVYEKPIANVILSRENLYKEKPKAFPLK
jgi:hypothetical protein